MVGSGIKPHFGSRIDLFHASSGNRDDRNLDACKSRQENVGPMAGSDKRKQSLYFPEDMLKEIQDEAARQDRSLSWIVQKAWKIARKEIMKYPSVNEFPGEEDTKEVGG